MISTGNGNEMTKEQREEEILVDLFLQQVDFNEKPIKTENGQMQAELKDGKLIITLDVANPPRPSTSGKTLLVASTGGFKPTTVEIKGKTVSVSVNATVKK